MRASPHYVDSVLLDRSGQGASKALPHSRFVHLDGFTGSSAAGEPRPVTPHPGRIYGTQHSSSH
jgi:hypothetical protein